MAQGQIRKGFFFYFGLFVLLMVAIFLVCVVVMIFNPYKTVLWMQYFSDNTTYHVEKTTDESETEIVWSEVKDLGINCSYASVTIERNNNNKYPKDGLYIYNNAKGFTAAADAVKFDIKVEYVGDKLEIDISEPRGFLFFSKSISIVLHSTSINNGTTNFDGMNLTVNTQDGNVNLGGSYPTYVTDVVKLKSVNVETGKGNVLLTDNFDSNSVKKFDVKTGSGNISTSRQVKYSTSEEEKTGSGLVLGGIGSAETATLTTDSGLISLDFLSSSSNLDITCKKGNVVLDCVSAKKVRFVSCEQGNYVFGEVFGDLIFDSKDSIISPNISANKIHGNFVLGTESENGSAPNIILGEVDGALMIYSNKGKLNVGVVSGDIEVISADSLSVNVGVAEENLANKTIKNKKGSVKLAFRGKVLNDVKVETQSGNIVIDVTKDAQFSASMWKFSNSEEDVKEMLPDGNISVNIGDKVLNAENPRLEIGVGGIIEIFTNAHVDFNLVEKDA